MKILEINNLQISYNNIPILKEISFDVTQGEYICIVGRNGTGKSTLLKTIVGLKKSDKGNININIPINEVSYLEQVNTNSNEFPITVKEVILTGRQSHNKFFYNKLDYKKLYELVKLLDIEEILNKRIGSISGGQKQRVMLARALAKNPKLLILDEPLAGLDSKISAEIYDLLKKLNKEFGITILITLHDLEQAKNQSDRIIALDNGKIIYDGKSSKWEVT